MDSSLFELIKNEVSEYFNGKNVQVDDLLTILDSFIKTPVEINKAEKQIGLKEEFLQDMEIVYKDFTSFNAKNSCKALSLYEDFLRKIIFFKNRKEFNECKDLTGVPLLERLDLIPPDPRDTSNSKKIWLDEEDKAHEDELKNYNDSEYEYHLIQAYRLRNINAHTWDKMNQRKLIDARYSLTVFYLEVLYRCKKYLNNKLCLPDEGIEYYARWVDKNGVPFGVRKLSLGQVKKRSDSYKFIIKNQRVIKVIHINSLENPVNKSGTFEDPVIQEINYPDDNTIKIFCTNSVGKIEYIKEYKKYKGSFNRVNFYKGSESRALHLSANSLANSFYNPFDLEKTKAEISGWKLARDKNGFVIRKTNLRFHNEDYIQADSNGIYSEEYEVSHDASGLVLKIRYLGRNGEKIQFREGWAVVQFKYDGNGEEIERSMLNKKETVISKLLRENDEFGNLIEDRVYDSNSKKLFTIKYKYNDIGQRVAINCFDSNKNPCFYEQFAPINIYAYDEYGYEKSRSFFERDGKPIFFMVNSTTDATAYCHKILMEHDEFGFVRKVSYFDTKGNPLNRGDGTEIIKHDYDSKGNIIEDRYFNKDNELTNDSQGCAIVKHIFDNENMLVKTMYFDATSKPAKVGNGYYAVEFKYYNGDVAENIQEIRFLDAKGKLTETITGDSKLKLVFNEKGLLIRQSFYDKNEKLLECNHPARIEYEYDSCGNLIRTSFYDSKDMLRSCICMPENISGAIIERELKNINGETVRILNEKKEIVYQVDTCFDEYGNPVKITNYSFSENVKKFLRCTNQKFDSCGNKIEIYDTNENNELIPNKNSVFKVRIEYDNRGFIVSKKYYDNKDQLVNEQGADYAYFIRKHDYMGNITERFFYDKKNKHFDSGKGCYGDARIYDSFGRLVSMFYLDKAGNKISAADVFCIRMEYIDNAKENVIIKTFNRKNEVIKNLGLFYYEVKEENGSVYYSFKSKNVENFLVLVKENPIDDSEFCETVKSFL